MGLFDKFKKGKTAPAKEPEVKIAEPQQKAEPKSEPQVTGQYREDLLVKPLLSEKGMHFASIGRYVFVVKRKASKPEIKKSIQKIYSVHVEDVKIVNLPAKKRGSGQRVGMTSAIKKAIVILRKGEKLPGIVESVG